MPTHVLNVFDLSDISTDDPDGFSNNGGYQFDWGVSTITIATNAAAIPVSMIDTADDFFDDDAGAAQVSDQVVTLNGTTYPSGTNMEAEYKITVQDAEGNSYEIQFVSMAGDAYDIAGFVIQGSPAPPFGVPLTVVSTQDVANGQFRYDTSQAPTCFALGTTVLTRAGPRVVERLRRGDWVVGPDGEETRIEMVLHTREVIRHKSRAPIRLRKGTLGEVIAPGLPHRCLVLSPQHRVLLEAALGPARGLTGLRGVGPMVRVAQVDWVHVVTAHHALLLTEGVPCETFWPGPEAMRALLRGVRWKVRRIMGADPQRARPFLTVAETRRLLPSLSAPRLP